MLCNDCFRYTDTNSSWDKPDQYESRAWGSSGAWGERYAPQPAPTYSTVEQR